MNLSSCVYHERIRSHSGARNRHGPKKNGTVVPTNSVVLAVRFVVFNTRLQWHLGPSIPAISPMYVRSLEDNFKG